MIRISFHILCAILIFAMIPACNGEAVEYRACAANFSCGLIQNVGYPFWGGNRPQFCGVQEFQLTCNGSEEYPSIDIGMLPDQGKVLSVNTSSRKMVITLLRFLLHDRRCHATLIMPVLTLKNPFKLNSNDQNISLFYSCPSSVPKNQTKSYACSYNATSKGSVVYFLQRPGLIESEMNTCTVKFTSAVLRRNLDELNNSNATLLSVLSKGFEMEYEVVNMTTCLACQNSGGYCGSSYTSSSSEFVCHCPDGSHPSLCPKSGRSKSNIIRAVIAAATLGVVILLLIVICLRKRHSISKFVKTRGTTQKENRNVEAFLQSYGSFAPKRYTYKDIKKMTKSFKETLGEGGYGNVYKGNLVNGRSVAVKLLHKLTGNGEEFLNEVFSISRTNHVNIVTLLGFCIEGKKRALVYEFLPNGSLDKFIQGASSGAQALPSESMFNIAVGIAKGLDYLHQGCNTRILHFDIKPHNILLDDDLCPKISDFGLARLFPKEQSHLSMLEARGTIGYIAPEICCRSFGGISHKSDVYSFGMMILDMVCGGRNNIPSKVQDSNDSNFPQWIYDQLEIEDGVKLQEVMDDEEGKLQKKMIVVSLWCIQAYPVNRPSMNKVVEMLEGSLESLQMPPKPYLSSSSVSTFDSFSISDSTT